MGGTEKLRGPTLPVHGASVLPSVIVDAYNCELEDDDGFVGDKASKAAFHEILDHIRKASEEDPFGKKASKEIGKKKLGQVLSEGEAEAAAVVQSAIEDFAQQLATVIKRFLRLKAWRDTECIVIGGGFRAGRIGELSIARAGILLREDDVTLDLQPIHSDPDEAGLIGAAHLVPAWMLNGHDAMLAVDVGGSNIRAGIVELNLSKGKDLSKARVFDMKLWRHKEDEPDRDDAVEYLTDMLSSLAKEAKKATVGLAPIMGIGCPGLIEMDGSITRGAHNLPGNWESKKFNLPSLICEAIPTIGGHQSMVLMHNDAVVQGLSELPHLDAYKRWGVLTIGTGLGNARFSRAPKKKRKA
jgi:predicted NBD/HSP70 family sugar kinase